MGERRDRLVGFSSASDGVASRAAAEERGSLPRALLLGTRSGCSAVHLPAGRILLWAMLAATTPR